MSLDDFRTGNAFPTIALINPTEKQEQFFRGAINFGVNYLINRNKTLDAEKNAMDEKSFTTIQHDKDRYLIFNANDYKLYYCMARMNPVIMKTMVNLLVRHSTNNNDHIDKRVFNEICNYVNMVWFDVDGEPLPMGIVPIFKVHRPTASKISEINESINSILDKTGMFNLIAKEEGAGLKYYLEYRDIKDFLQAVSIISIRNQVINNVRCILGDETSGKWEYYDEVNNKNRAPESFITNEVARLIKNYDDESKPQTLPELKKILSENPVDSKFYPVIISELETVPKSNIYNASITKLLKRADMDAKPNFTYSVIKHDGKNYSVLYTDNKQVANYIIQHSPSLEKFLKNNDKRFYVSPTYVINNYGNAIPIGYLPICEMEQESKSYVEALSILNSNMKRGYRLATIHSGNITQCYIAPKTSEQTSSSNFARVKADKVSLLYKLRLARIDCIALDDNGMPTEYYKSETSNYDQELYNFM